MVMSRSFQVCTQGGRDGGREGGGREGREERGREGGGREGEGWEGREEGGRREGRRGEGGREGREEGERRESGRKGGRGEGSPHMKIWDNAFTCNTLDFAATKMLMMALHCGLLIELVSESNLAILFFQCSSSA